MAISPEPKFGWSLICLTSTRHRRFVEDIIALTALPVGAHWRFRYLLKYVDPAVLVLADTHAGKGVQLLLGISSFDEEPLPRNANASYGRHLDALRRGKALSIRKAGELLIIDFEVGPFLEAFELANLAPSEVQKHLPARAVSEAPQGWFCSVVPASNGPSDSALLDGWERAAETTLNRTSADLVPFVFGIMPSAEPKARPKIRNGQLTLQAGRRTQFEVHALARKAGSSSPYKRATGEIKLGLSHPSFSFTTSSTMRIDTHRNAKTLAFQSAPAFKESVGHLSILAFSFGDPAKPTAPEETSTDREGKRPALVRIDLALSTGKSRTWLFCSLAGVVLALSSTSFAKEMPTSLEIARIGVIVLLSVFGLRQGLTLKG